MQITVLGEKGKENALLSLSPLDVKHALVSAIKDDGCKDGGSSLPRHE